VIRATAVLFAARKTFGAHRAVSFPGENKSAPPRVFAVGPERIETGPLLTQEVSVMKTKLAAVALTAMTFVLPWASALADGPRASSYHAISQPTERQAGGVSASHYEWQYHYVGRHPRFEGHWVLVQ
jgi:hypothetical protein